MFRRPPLLSTREEDTYDYLSDDLDEHQQVLSIILKTKANGLYSFDLCKGISIIMMDELRRKTWTSVRVWWSCSNQRRARVFYQHDCEGQFFPGNLYIRHFCNISVPLNVPLYKKKYYCRVPFQVNNPLVLIGAAAIPAIVGDQDLNLTRWESC